MGSLSWKSVAGLVLTSILLYTFTACGDDQAAAPTAIPTSVTTPTAMPTSVPTALPTPAATATPTQVIMEPFRIGVMESITGPGETYGNVAVQAKQMAVSEINEAGGVNGRKLELVVEDSKCGAQDAIIAYKKLTSVDGIKIILGTSCSGAMLGVAPLAESDGVVLFSGLASNPDIADAGDYIFRTQISDVEVGIKHRQRPLGRRNTNTRHHY